MPVRELSGFRHHKDMPPRLRAMLPPTRSMSDAHGAFKGLAKSSPQTDHDIPNEPPAFDQLDIGSCVLNAVVGALLIALAVTGKPFVMLARLFLYWLCRLWMGTLDEDSGTYIALAVERVGAIGICEERVWPYDDAHFLDENGKAVGPTAECFPEASDNRPTAWFLVDDADASARLEQFESAVRADHPVIFGLQLDSKIRSYVAGDVLTTPNPNDIIGGHAMVITGVHYRSGKRIWRVRNSWGVDFGDAGHLDADDGFMSTVLAGDAAVLTRADPLLF